MKIILIHPNNVFRFKLRSWIQAHTVHALRELGMRLRKTILGFHAGTTFVVNPLTAPSLRHFLEVFPK